MSKRDEKDEILEQAVAMKRWMVEIRRDFHQYPELGREEFRTQEKIIRLLDEMGIPYQTNIAHTAVVGFIKGKHEGKTVALRADMDALPIDDAKDVPYRSKVPGKMHACGHDAHTTILLGAAKILNDMRAQLKGNVKLFFQPAEETFGGAESMIEAGVMENPKVDAVFGLHVSPEMPTGEIGLKFGQMNASSDSIKITLHGKSTHGAYPHSGVDTIMMAGQVINALQTIVSRNVDPRDSAVVTLGKINGGTQGNIIADKVEMVGTVRTLDPNVRERVLERIEKIVLQVAEAMGGSGEVLRKKGYTALINHDEMVESVKANAEALLGPDKVKIIKSPSLGVEDFAYFLQEAPGAFYRLGCRNEEKGMIHDGHNGLFDVDEDCLEIGVALQVKNVLRVLGKE
ncbi:amidohydrolase [Alkaliphilus metalliredigens QYMF]|uniref:Amidohydrolase n=1 Tax=Alkaliphilus metalliredigens (strain QYMF) TaxID=293826 RepID=A6TW42_ALKMQ|nr:amidohydrolase [Alkaliphilus metalliredigens]ABR50410.1 amidohydrolase [Alkaliphilus metalliredigens QYMF]